MQLRDAVEEAVRRWHALEQSRGEAPVIDFDCAPPVEQPSPFDNRFAALDDLTRLRIEAQSSASLTGEDAGCQFPTGLGGQVCGRSVVRSGAPGRPSSYCDLDGHTRAKAFAARRRFELAAARGESGEYPGPGDADVAAGERPVTDGRASFGVAGPI